MGVMSVSYLTVDGEIISETRSGVESDYIPDPLGSTAALTNANAEITDSFGWWPYGELRSHSGSNITPIGFIGTQGYYKDTDAREYVRANMLGTSIGRWLSPDRFPKRPSAYAYVSDSPVTWTDPKGLWQIKKPFVTRAFKKNLGYAIMLCIYDAVTESPTDLKGLLKVCENCVTAAAAAGGAEVGAIFGVETGPGDVVVGAIGASLGWLAGKLSGCRLCAVALGADPDKECRSVPYPAYPPNYYPHADDYSGGHCRKSGYSQVWD